MGCEAANRNPPSPQLHIAPPSPLETIGDFPFFSPLVERKRGVGGVGKQLPLKPPSL